MAILNQNRSSLEQQKIQHKIVIIEKQKSVGLAFLFAFLFGPLGLLYASIIGGIIMCVLAIIISIFTLGLGLILVWPISIIWAIIAVSSENKRVLTTTNQNQNESFSQRSSTQIEHPKPASVSLETTVQEIESPEVPRFQQQSEFSINQFELEKEKNVVTALLLSFIFGPIGLLYASLTGGLIMIIVGTVVSIFTFGFGLIFIWIGSIIWSFIAVDNVNKRIATKRISQGYLSNQNSNTPSESSQFPRIKEPNSENHNIYLKSDHKVITSIDALNTPNTSSETPISKSFQSDRFSNQNTHFGTWSMIIIFVIIIATSIITNPTTQEHQNATRELIASETNENKYLVTNTPHYSIHQSKREKSDPVLERLPIDIIIKSYIKRKNYFIFSLTSFDFKGLKKNIGIGFFSSVFINEKDLKEILETNNYFFYDNNNHAENIVTKNSDTTSVSISTAAPKTDPLIERYTNVESIEKRPPIADNIQNGSNLKNQIWEILDTYYQINESSKCDQLVNFFTPVVDNYFDKANQSITQIVNDCIKYHSRWPYQEINLDKSSLQIGILQNGDYSVHYNLFYKVKQQLNDNWKSFYLTTTIGLTPGLKIRSINESRN